MHNTKLFIDIDAKAGSNAKDNVSQSLSYLLDDELSELYNITKLNALNEFDKRKMGDDETAHIFRRKLEFILDMRLWTELKELNELKKFEYYKFKAIKTGGLGASGGGLCGMILGVGGAFVCGIGGALYGALT